MLHVTKLIVTNYMGLDYVKITAPGKFVRITGENGAGKSSILAALQEAVKGSGGDVSVIKTGTDTAEVLLELDDRILVERKITPRANTVKVSIDGTPQSKPAAYLAGLIGPTIFNPVAFFNAKPRVQRQLLLSAMPCTVSRSMIEDACEETGVTLALDDVDFGGHGLEVLANVRTRVYDWRHREGQTTERLKKSIEQDRRDLPDGVGDRSWEDFDRKETVEKIAEASAAANEQGGREQRLDLLRKEYARLGREITAIEDTLKDLQERQAANVAAGETLKAEVEGFEPIDTTELQGELDGYEEYLKQQATLEGIERKETEQHDSDQIYQGLDELHGKLRDELPAQLIESMDIPFPGLNVSDDAVTVDGKPLSRLSTAERVPFAVRLARALAGDLKIVCIDGYEALVGKLRKAFEKEMDGDDFEYWIAEAVDGPLTVNGEAPGKRKAAAK